MISWHVRVYIQLYEYVLIDVCVCGRISVVTGACLFIYVHIRWSLFFSTTVERSLLIVTNRHVGFVATVDDVSTYVLSIGSDLLFRLERHNYAKKISQFSLFYFLCVELAGCIFECSLVVVGGAST